MAHGPGFPDIEDAEGKEDCERGFPTAFGQKPERAIDVWMHGHPAKEANGDGDDFVDDDTVGIFLTEDLFTDFAAEDGEEKAEEDCGREDGEVVLYLGDARGG